MKYVIADKFSSGFNRVASSAEITQMCTHSCRRVIARRCSQALHFMYLFVCLFVYLFIYGHMQKKASILLLKCVAKHERE